MSNSFDELAYSKGGAVLAIRLELDDEAPPGLWIRMLVSRDVVFLVLGD